MKVFVLLFALVALCHGKGFDYVSKYYGDVRTGVVDPNFYSSEFSIESDLHIQFADEHATDYYFYFKNPKVFVANGEIPMSGPTKPHVYQPFPEEIEKYFTEPFFVRYENDLIKHVYTKHAEEPKWSLNLKKSVANILQFNETRIGELLKVNEPITFVAEQPTLYGNCLVQVTMKQNEKLKDGFIIDKYFPPSDCYHYEEETYNIFDHSPVSTGAADEKKNTGSVRHQYYVEKANTVKGYTVTKVESLSYISYSPFRSYGDIYYANVNQTILFKGLESIDFTATIDEYKIVHDPDFEQNHDTELDILKELTYYVTENEQPIYKTNLDFCVKEIKKYSEDLKDTEPLYHLLHKLPFFTFDELKECYQTLYKKEDTHFITIFYELLPNIGSKASTLFMVHLFENEKIKTDVAVGMIQMLPFYLRVPKESVLQDLKKIISDEYVVKPEVKSAAILAYGTLIYRTYKKQFYAPESQEYIDIYYQHLKHAKTYQDQVIWLQGLANIQVNDVYKYLVPIIRGEQVLDTKYDDNLRVHAIRVLDKYMYLQSLEIMNSLWTIILDNHTAFKVRAEALRIYLIGCQDVGSLSILFWHMQNDEKCPHMYNLYYSAMKSLSETSNIFNTVAEAYAKKTLKLLKTVGVETSSSVYIHEAYDEKYGIGTRVMGAYIADDKTNNINSFSLYLDSIFAEKLTSYYTMYVTFEGITNPIADFMKFNDNEMEIKKFSLKETGDDTPIHFEVTLLLNERVIYTKNFDFKEEYNIDDFSLKDLVKAIKVSDVAIHNALASDVVVPTEIGVPATITFRMPSIFKYNYERIPTVNMELKQKFDFYYEVDGFYGIKMFSPFSSTWHGVVREFYYTLQFPIAFTIDFKNAPNFGLTVEAKDFDDHYFGYKSQVQTVTFLEHTTDADYVKKSSDSERYYEITQGSNSYENHIETTTYPEFGVDYYVELICQPTPQHLDVYNEFSIEDWYNVYLSQFGKVPFTKFLMYYNNYIFTHLLSPGLTECYHEEKLTKSESHPFDIIKFHFDLDSENDTSTNWYIQQEKFIFNYTLDINMPDEHDNKEWSGEFKFTSEHGETFKEVEFYANRFVKHQPNKNLCFDWNKEMHQDHSTGQINFYYSETYEKECAQDQFYVSVDWKGTKSEEQNTHAFDKFLTYRECFANADYYSFHMPTTYECLYAHTTLRDYVYDITYGNVPNDVDTFFRDFWTFVTMTYHTEEDYEFDAEVHDGFRVEVTYPMTSDHHLADVEVRFPEVGYFFNQIVWPFNMESTHFTDYFQMRKDYNIVYKCYVNPHGNEGKYHEIILPEDDKFYSLVEDAHNNTNWAIYASETPDHHTTMKFVFNNSTGIVHTDAEGHMKYEIDEQMFKYLNHYESFDDIYNFKLYQVQDTVVLVAPELSLFATYDGHSVKVEFVKLDEHFHGLCVE